MNLRFSGNQGSDHIFSLLPKSAVAMWQFFSRNAEGRRRTSHSNPSNSNPSNWNWKTGTDRGDWVLGTDWQGQGTRDKLTGTEWQKQTDRNMLKKIFWVRQTNRDRMTGTDCMKNTDGDWMIQNDRQRLTEIDWQWQINRQTELVWHKNAQCWAFLSQVFYRYCA